MAERSMSRDQSSQHASPMGHVVHQPRCSVQTPQISIFPMSDDTRKMRRVGWAHDSARRCSYIQMGIGTFCFVLQLIGSVIGIGGAEYYTGIWAGLFYIFTGLLGYFAAKIKNTPRIVCYMAFNYTILIIIFIATLTFTIIAINRDYAIKKPLRVFNIILLTNHIVMAFVALIASSLSCHGACCLEGCCSCTCLDTDAVPTYVAEPVLQQKVIYIPVAVTQENPGSPEGAQALPPGAQYTTQSVPAHNVQYPTQGARLPQETYPVEVNPSAPSLSNIEPPPSYDTVAMEILQES